MAKKPRLITKQQILDVLRKNPDKLFNISDIARELDIASGTVSKYSLVLEAEGKVKIIRLGGVVVIQLNETEKTEKNKEDGGEYAEGY